MNCRAWDRRTILKQAAATGAAAGLSRLGLARQAQKTRAIERVVLVSFAGGVRSRETIQTPGNVPTLMAMAKEGVTYTRVRSSNLGHFGAALSMFTGISEARGIRENARGGDPTVFEYVRKDLGLGAGEVWIATSGGAQQTNFSHGLHSDYGPLYGASTLDGDGIFNAEFKAIVAAYGQPRQLGAEEQALLDEMRRASQAHARSASKSGAPDAESNARIERYILDELGGGTVDLRGANAADAKALRIARNVVSIFRPKLTAVVLQQADVAHGSFNGYLEIIRQNDASLGELWNAIREDPALAETTAIFVCPEFGRDSDLNSRRGLDHGDGSEDLNFVSCVAWGGAFQKNKVVTDDVRVIDLCPTVCSLLGAKARLARGKNLPHLLA